MKKYTLYHVDAFAETPFSGNPAAVVILDEWPDDGLLQNIAMENNLSETAFLIPEGDLVRIRYFSPTIEIDLCGHATLASAFVLFHFWGMKGTILRFRTRKRGDLFVFEKDETLWLDFPSDRFQASDIPAITEEALGKYPVEAYKGTNDLMLVYRDEKDISAIEPHFDRLATIAARGVLVTAPGKEVDFVSRFFAPQVGIPEDPVTGSAHTLLIPYWSERLGKTRMIARQLSKRGGTLYCESKGARVLIGGKARHYLTGEIFI